MQECGEGCHILRMYNAAYSACPTVTCASSSAATTALSALDTNNCDTDCTSNACKDSYRIIRRYHDSCEAEDIAEAVGKEDGEIEQESEFEQY